MKILCGPFRSAFGIVAFSSVSMASLRAASAAGSLPDASTCVFGNADAVLTGAVLAGTAAGCAVLAVLFREKAQWYVKQLLRQKARLEFALSHRK